jgi:hypothetical protein
VPFFDSLRARSARQGTLLCIALTLCSHPTSAQTSVTRSVRLLPAPWQPPQPLRGDSAHSARSWIAPVASALIPGAGQLLRGEDRGAVYFIAEAFLAQRFVSLWTDARHEEERYHEIALKVARAPFGPHARDTVFEYFEQMGKFAASGPFDTDPGPSLIPPTDEATYNGAIWALARRTYFTGNQSPPDTSLTYQSALAFYRRRAIGPNYQWSWQSAGLEQELFRQTIQQGDEKFRRATQQLGFLLANHFLSAVDAFVSQRLSRSGRRIELDHRFSLSGRSRTAALGVILRISL